ncbi:MAG: iron ABC transporter permease [Candidatus Accumulibacter sp.]|nr:iron ABC transporter permease [Accumulibacter sp.]
MRGRTGACVLLVALLLSTLVSLSLGRFSIPLKTVAAILLEPLFDIPAFWSNTEAQVVWAVRFPRVALAAFVGAGLALAGASLQSLFRNPLADPQILGVSSGAALGGVVGILLAGTGWPTICGSFAGGIASLALVFWLAGGTGAGRGSAVMLVLAGLVVGAVGAAGIALVKYAADPDNQLPAIVFWLLGSLAAADKKSLYVTAPPILFSAALILGLRFHLSALAVGEEDARNLGVPVRTVRLLALGAAGLATAAAVAVSGVVGWVGLVVPHLVRLSFGANHRWFFLNTLLGGAGYLILVDTAARTLVAAEIPLGALTALLGAPIFAVLLRRLRGKTDA